MLKRLQADNPDDQLIVIFDAKGPTFRNDIYSEYKANRPPMPDELGNKSHPSTTLFVRSDCHSFSTVSGMTMSLAHVNAAPRETGSDSTGDKDMAQLVNEHVTLVHHDTNSRTERV